MSNNIIKRTWKQGGLVNIEDLRGSAFQAENGGHTFLISGLDENGDALALSGTPAGVLLRADGQDVTLTCSVSEGVVSATLPAAAYVVPGRIGITIFLTSGGQKTAIYAAVGSVATTSSGIVAPPAGSDVVDLVNAIQDAIALIPASDANLKAAMAPTYSTSAVYAVGSYAWYDGKLYRCTTAITSGETWTSAHWTQANLGSDVSDLKSAYTNTRDEITNETEQYAISKLSSWMAGAINNDGTTYTSTKACRTYIIDLKVSHIEFTVKTGYKIKIAEYGNSSSTDSFTRFMTTEQQGKYWQDNVSGKYYMIEIRATDGSTLAPADVPSDALMLQTAFYKTDHLENEVPKLMDEFFEQSANLINVNTLIKGKYIGTDGSIGDNSNYAITDYISVEPNTTYTEYHVMRTAFYDINKTFIGYVNNNGTTIPTFDTPYNCEYVRLSSDYQIRSWKFGKGSSEPASANYFSRVKNDKIDTSNAPITGTRPLATEVISSMLENKENLFSLDNFTDGIAILSNGTEDTNYNYKVSGYIPVNPGEELIANKCTNIAEYTKDKTFIKRIAPSASSFVVSDQTYYVRISSDYAVTMWQLNRGSTLLEFTYGGKQSNVPLTKEASRSKDLILFSEDIRKKYILENVPTFSLSTSMTAEQIYEAYDGFVTDYPDYVSKEELGEDDFGNMISLYKFTPVDVEHTRPVKRPVVMITCSVHGYERISPIVTYYVMKEIIENWRSSSILEVLRHDVIFYIIPVAVPSGWNADTRTNGNGVDINRNFPAGYATTESERGTAPLSEKETQYINEVLQDNTIDIFMDFHNFTWQEFPTRPQQFMWIVSTDSLTQHVALKYIGRMTRVFRDAYSFVSQDESVMFGYTDGARLGMSKDQAKKEGAMISCTFELASKYGAEGGQQFNTEHKQACMECVVNFIALSLEAIQLQYREPNIGNGQSNY